MMMTVVDTMWLRLHAILEAFARRVTSVDPTLIHNLGRTANNAFLLRGYVAFRKHAAGEEVAVTVDVQDHGEQLTIESDASTDDGRVLAVGPSAALSSSDKQWNVEAAVDGWMRDFERFLLENESAVVRATSQLL